MINKIHNRQHLFDNKQHEPKEIVVMVTKWNGGGGRHSNDRHVCDLIDPTMSHGIEPDVEGKFKGEVNWPLILRPRELCQYIRAPLVG